MRLSAAISTMGWLRRRGETPPGDILHARATFLARRMSAAATVVATWDETPTMLGLRLSAPEIEAAHHAPGQFLTLQASTPVAIASAPGHGLELLIKKDGTAHEILGDLRVGERIDVDGPSGHGYPLAHHAGRDLVLLGAGSGIAPLRAVVQ